MKRCLRCFRNYEENKTECPWCGFRKSQQLKEPQYLSAGIVLQNRYEIGAVVGAGGFGITYAAWDRVLEQRVAIKEYMPGEFSTRTPGETRVSVYGGEKEEQYKNGRDKFYEESQRLAKFQDVPGIVQIYNSFEENETAYLVMEFLEGETLGERLKRDKRIPEQEAVGIILPVLQALTEVHRVGILHRDIAPNNIFLTKDGGVKLLDFGASRSVTGTHSKSLTVLYKEGYTPEEQYRSRGDQGTWTDVYEVAATLYKMLTGTVPPGALERRRKDTLKLPSKMGIKVTKQTEQALLNALNVDVRYRTKTADAFMQELLGTEKTKAHFVRTEEKKQGSIPLWIKGLVGTLLCGMGVYLVLLFTGVISGSGIGFSHFGIPEGSTRVPNLVNTEIEEAQKKADESNLKFLITDKQFSTTIPENRILSQELAAGSLTEKESSIRVVVSAGLNSMTAEEIQKEGIELVQIPDLQYQDMKEAVGMLQDAGLDVKLEYVTTGIVEGGKVTAQSVAAGEQLVKGESITLSVEDQLIDWTEAEAVETAVREEIGRETGDIYASDMGQIQQLTVRLPEKSEANLKVLGNCVALERLDISGEMSSYRIGSDQESIIVDDYSTRAKGLDKLSDLRNLTALEINGVNLEKFSELGELKQLTKLKLCCISVRDISIIANLTHLQRLDLSGMEVSDISSLYDLVDLKSLNIDRTNIKSFPDNFPLENIENLWIKESVFNNIRNKERLKNISMLQLSDWDGDKQTGENLKKLKTLKTLKLDSLKRERTGAMENKRIISLDFLRGLNQIEEIEFGASLRYEDIEFKENGEVLDSLKGLKCITINGDALVKEIESVQRIRELNLYLYSGAYIDINCLSKLKNLEVLKIVLVDEVPRKKICGLEELQSIRAIIFGNPNKELIESVLKLSELEEFTIYNTELSDLNVLKDAKKLRKITIGQKCPNLTMESIKELNQLKEIYFYPDTDENKIEELRKLQDAG